MLSCSGCGYEVAPDFAFCPRCGRGLPRRCSACGAPCEREFAFCPRCGVSQAPEAPARPQAVEREADRRHVTVLFADLTGFTALAERLDP
jgi:adenylate cyclase